VGKAQPGGEARRAAAQPGQPRPPRPAMPPQPAWGGIRQIDLQTGAVTKVVDVPFQMGHIPGQSLRARRGHVLHETGGDAPQRMWITRSDGSENRPLYKRKPRTNG